MSRLWHQLSRYLRRWYRGHVLSACLNWEDPPSLLALDPRGEIVGAVLGYRTRRSDPRNPGAFSPLVHRLRRLLPARIVDLNLTARFDRERLRYDAHLAMDDLGCSDVFVGETLCVASSCRGLGLGRALLRASVGAAGAAGAEVYFSCVTGVYSQKIYRDCDFDDLREVPYSDVRNNKGEPLLPETGEHEKAAVMFKRLRQREEPLKSGELAGNG